MKKIMLAASIFFVASCSVNNVDLEKKARIEIKEASAAMIANTDVFLSALRTSSRVVGDSKFNLANFESGDLNKVLVTDGEKSGSSYVIFSKNNPAVGLLVNIDDFGNVANTIYTENIVVSEGVVDTKYYDMDGNIRIYFTTTNSEVVFHDVPEVNGRISGWGDWFSAVGDCVSTAAQPFDNGVLNLAFDAAATYATGGAYPVVLVAGCVIFTEYE